MSSNQEAHPSAPSARPAFVPPRPPVLQPNVAALLNKETGSSPKPPGTFTPPVNPFSSRQPSNLPKSAAPKTPQPPSPVPFSPSVAAQSPSGQQQAKAPEVPSTRASNVLPQQEQQPHVATVPLTRAPLTSTSPHNTAPTSHMGQQHEQHPHVVTVPLTKAPLTTPPTSHDTTVRNEDVDGKQEVDSSVDRKEVAQTTKKTGTGPASDPQPVIKTAQPTVSDGSERIDMTGGLVSWFTKTMAESKLLSDVAEKAKAGMETVLTTLDPGMKPFLADHGVIEVAVFNVDSSVASVLQQSFDRAGALALVRTLPTSREGLRPLVSGDANALKSCRIRAERAALSKLAAENALIVVLQPVLIEIEKTTYAATKVLARTKYFEATAIGQLLEVPGNVYDFLKKSQNAEDVKNGEYSMDVSIAVSEVLQRKEDESWSSASGLPPFSSSELLGGAFLAIAQKYVNHINSSTGKSTS